MPRKTPKKSKSKQSSETVKEEKPEIIQTTAKTILCPVCKNKVVFIDKQEAKSCPSCGSTITQ